MGSGVVKEKSISLVSIVKESISGVVFWVGVVCCKIVDANSFSFYSTSFRGTNVILFGS